jgi:hypothetical protein
VGNNGFVATAIDIYPSWGNTQYNNYSFACNNSPILAPGLHNENNFITFAPESFVDEVSVYPNPNNGYFKVESKMENKISEISVFDAIGQLIFNSRGINSNQVEMNLSGKSKTGICVVVTKLENNTIHTCKIIINSKK